MTRFNKRGGALLILLLSLSSYGLTTSAQTSEEVSLNATGDAVSVSGARDLQQVFEHALDYSPRLSIAKEQWNIGKARTDQATGQLLPQISARGSFSQNRRYTDQTFRRGGELVTEEVLEKYDGEKYSAQLTQVLFNWSAFQARARAAQLENQTEAEYYEELSLLLVDVAEKYLDVLEARDALTSIRGEKKSVLNQLQQIERLYQRQLVKVTDQLEARARLAAVEADEIDILNQLAMAREALMEITGLDVQRLYTLDEQQDIPRVEGTIASWLDRAYAHNQSLKARRYALRAAQKGVSEKRGEYLPELALVVSHQKSDIGYENSAAPLTETTYTGLDLTIPLFAGGTNRAGVREAISRASIARSEMLQLRNELTRNVRAAYLQAQSSLARTRAAEQLLASSRKAAAAMQKGFTFGTVTSVDVFNALRDEFVAQRDLQKARYGHIKALLQLKRAAGVIGPDDLATVNSWLQPPG